MIVLGLGHKARHGKNYLSGLLLQQAAIRGLRAKEYGFADALKAVCRVQFGMRQKDAPLLQMVGTELYRRQNPDVWVDALRYRIEEEQPDIAIVADMRFPNEADMIKAMGGKTINVTRLTENGELWVATDRDPHHPSEVALDGYAYDLLFMAKTGDLKQFEAAATDIAHLLFDVREVRA